MKSTFPISFVCLFQLKHQKKEYWHSDCLSITASDKCCFHSFPPGQNGHHFADDTFKYIFMNEKFCILIPISLKFVPKGPINNKSALVQVLAWHQIGDKSLSEPMLTWFTDAFVLCGTRGRWVNSLQNKWRKTKYIQSKEIDKYTYEKTLSTSLALGGGNLHPPW